MNPDSDTDETLPTDAEAAAIPPNGGEYKTIHPGSTGCLIRRVPSDQGGYDFVKNEFKLNAFFPRPADDTGLSVNWEGSEPEFETAHTLLAKAQGQKLRECGGVIAVTFEAVVVAGLHVVRDDTETSHRHSLIPELKRPIYEAKRNEFIDYADKLLRAANQQPTRIAPKPLPKS